MRARNGHKGVACVMACAAIGAAAASARGVVVVGGEPAPQPAVSYVGLWNGATGVAIGSNWIISARHVGGQPGSVFVLGDQAYTADLVIGHPTEDVLLARLTEPLPGHHRLAPLAAAGQEVLLAGMGYRAGESLGNGWAWSASGLAWGSNRLDGVGARMLITFDEPASAAATVNESIFTMLDSGGGVFVDGPSGPELAGIAVSVTGVFGSSLYGARSFAVNLEPLRAWILHHVAPGEPIASSIGPTRAPSIPAGPAVPGPASVVLSVAAGLWSLRRRR
jgi:hypothetical protein